MGIRIQGPGRELAAACGGFDVLGAGMAILPLRPAGRHETLENCNEVLHQQHVWLWQVYGGWRGHHHLCLEPWTGYPMQLEEAAAAGRARVLAPGDSLEAEVALVLYGGRDRVTSVEAHGAGFEIS